MATGGKACVAAEAWCWAAATSWAAAPVAVQCKTGGQDRCAAWQYQGSGTCRTVYRCARTVMCMRTRQEQDVAGGQDELGPHGMDDGVAAAHRGHILAVQGAQAWMREEREGKQGVNAARWAAAGGRSGLSRSGIQNLHSEHGLGALFGSCRALTYLRRGCSCPPQGSPR